MDYDDDLDALAVTVAHQDDEHFKGTVHLLDNLTGNKLKHIPLEEPWQEVLIIVLGNLMMSEILFYQMRNLLYPASSDGVIFLT